MPVNRLINYLLVGLITTLSACAQVPTVMSYFPGDLAAQSDRVWPKVPEVPRYRFEGLLTGEDNFGPENGQQSGVGKRVFRWLVGLGPGNRVQRQVLKRPQAGMVDSEGRIYITDIGRRAVFVFNEASGKMQIWDRAGLEDFISPIGIAPGFSGEILVADSGLGRIVRLDQEGKYLGNLGENVLERPTGLAMDPQSGLLYVADTSAHNIKVFNSTGEVEGVLGKPGKGVGEFNAPTHLAFRDGKLYVSDTLNARIQTFTMDENLAFSQAQVIGNRGLYIGNLTRPKGVGVDDDGNIYIVESYYDHLLVFDQQGKYLIPIGGTGNKVGQFFLPAGVWSDSRGRIFIADMFNGRVVILQYLGA